MINCYKQLDLNTLFILVKELNYYIVVRFKVLAFKTLKLSKGFMGNNIALTMQQSRTN
jgi:hypothetical protein